MLRKIAVVMLVVFVSSPAYSITQNEAVEYALNNNRDIRAFRFESDIAAGRLDKAMLPFKSNPVIEGNVVRKGKAPDNTVKEYNDFGLSISQEVEIAGQRGVRIDAAEKRLRVVSMEIKDMERRLSREVKDAFARSLAAKKKIALYEEALKVKNDLLEFTRVKFEAGDISWIELNLAELELGKAKRESLINRREYREALLTLQNVMGMKSDDGFDVDGELFPEKFSIPSREGLRSLALSQRPDMSAAALDVRRTDTEVLLAKREGVPNITFTGSYQRDEERNLFGLAVAVPIPVFDRKQAERREAAARAEQAKARRSGLEKAVENEIDAAYGNLSSSNVELALFQSEILHETEENMTLINLAFKEGKMSFYNVRLSQKDIIDSKNSYLDAQLRARLAINQLENAIGGGDLK